MRDYAAIATRALACDASLRMESAARWALARLFAEVVTACEQCKDRLPLSLVSSGESFALTTGKASVRFVREGALP